jgi:hypothetical protein
VRLEKVLGLIEESEDQMTLQEYYEMKRRRRIEQDLELDSQE